VGLVGATAWLRLQPAPPAPTTPAVPVVAGGLGGGGGGSAGQTAAIAVIKTLHEAISKHDQAGAIRCFTPDAGGTPPYGLDRSQGYSGIESSVARDFRAFGTAGDAATIECTVIVQTAQAYFTTPFAYRLKRQDGAWLIDSVSKLADTRRDAGRYVESVPTPSAAAQ
jgi:hypothetical protein